MKFSEALEKSIGTGIGIFRPSWNGNANRADEGIAQWVAPFFWNAETNPPVTGLPTNPFFYIQQPNGRTPWVPSQGDLFAEDWEML